MWSAVGGVGETGTGEAVVLLTIAHAMVIGVQSPLTSHRISLRGNPISFTAGSRHTDSKKNEQNIHRALEHLMRRLSPRGAHVERNTLGSQRNEQQYKQNKKRWKPT